MTNQGVMAGPIVLMTDDEQLVWRVVVATLHTVELRDQVIPAGRFDALQSNPRDR